MPLPTRLVAFALIVVGALLLGIIAGYFVGLSSVQQVEKTVTLESTATLYRTVTAREVSKETVLSTVEKTTTATVRVTSTLTTTHSLTITSTVTSTLTLLTQPTTVAQEPYVELGDSLSIVMPFIYFDSIVYHKESGRAMSGNWVVNGSYSVDDRGLVLSASSSSILAYNNVAKFDMYRVYIVKLSTPKIEGSMLVSLASIGSQSINRFVSVQISDLVKTYVSGKLASNQNFVELTGVNTIELLFAYAETSVEIFIKREGVDSDWVLLAQVGTPNLWAYGAKIAIELRNAQLIVESLAVYQLAPTGIRDLRPVFDWSSGRYDPRSILRDSEGRMLFFATGGFYKQALGILILRSGDLTSFEPVKLLIIKSNPWYTGQGFLFKWVDGKIHGYIMNWGGSYQGGTHRIVKIALDTDFNVVEVNENVVLTNAPPGGQWGHYDIAVFKFKGTWYALTSSFSAGTVLWRLEEGPTSTKFAYVKTIFESGHENPTIYPVVAPNGEVQLMLSVATDVEYGACHKIYILDTDFNPVKDYRLIGYRIWSAGHTFFLDPWYIYINQDQSSSRVFPGVGIWPGAFIEVYKLETNYRYYVEE